MFKPFYLYIVMEANFPSSSLDPSGVAARSLPSGKAILSFMFLMRWSAFALSKAFSWAERLRIISIPSVDADVVSLLISPLLAEVSTKPDSEGERKLRLSSISGKLDPWAIGDLGLTDSCSSDPVWWILLLTVLIPGSLHLLLQMEWR